MKRCKTCQRIVGLNNRCNPCSKKLPPKTCYVTTVSGIRCNRHAPAFNMCERHMMLLERLS